MRPRVVRPAPVPCADPAVVRMVHCQLDAHTCDYCACRHGTIIPAGSDRNLPPHAGCAHEQEHARGDGDAHRCRCVAVAYRPEEEE